jgi:NifB/MoaA-like Fe-S oxidoreductase
MNVIRDATPEELERFDTAFHALVPTPGFRAFCVSLALRLSKAGYENVTFGLFCSTAEAISYHHVEKEYAAMNRHLKETQRLIDEEVAQLNAEVKRVQNADDGCFANLMERARQLRQRYPNYIYT